MMKRVIFSGFSLGLILMLNRCASESVEYKHEKVLLELNDIQGQWTLIDIDTIIEKQSIEQNESRYWVEFERPEFELVDGVIQCINCDQFELSIPSRTIEFSADTIYEYVFPVRLRSDDHIKLVNNTIEFQYLGSSNGVWLESVGDISVELSKDNSKLFISYLEETGLYLKETYQKDNFDDSLVYILKNFRENLPAAAGKYSLVHSYFESVDYDSPFEHYHSFPHVIPETLDLDKDVLMEVLKNDGIINLETDNVLRPYELSWGWGENITLQPENWLYHPDSCWYQGPDTSMHIWYKKMK